jgi:hypothetical protein
MRRMCLKVLMCIHCPSPALSIFALSPLFLRPTTSERHSIPSSLSKLLGDDDLVCHSSRSKRKVTQLDSLPCPESIRVCQLLAPRISRWTGRCSASCACGCGGWGETAADFPCFRNSCISPPPWTLTSGTGECVLSFFSPRHRSRRLSLPPF